MWKYLPLIITSAIIYSWPQVYAWFVERKAAKLDVSNFSTGEFRISRVILIAIALCGCMGVGTFITIAVCGGAPLGIWVTIAVLLLALLMYGMVRLLQERLSISEAEVKHRHGKKETVIRRDSIKWAYVANGLYVIDTGSPTRTVISMHFERPALILALLKSSAERNAAVDQPGGERGKA